MRDIDLDNITTAVQASFAQGADPRFRTVVSALVAHLHAFAREVRLTHVEWEAAIDFLYRAGKISDERRNEFILTSDVLGLSSLVDLLDGAKAGTPSSVLGPFYVAGAPIVPAGASLVGDNAGERVLLHGRVLGPGGAPVRGALLDLWQTNAEGLYSQMDPTQPAYNLRCRMPVDDEGRYALVTVRPQFYSVPYDGPVGALLRAGGRHAWRPAHFHVLVTAPAHRRLVTELFVADDPYIDSDAVFGVRSALVGRYVRRDDAASAPCAVEAPYLELAYDFHLEPDAS
jgi:protocatechuate 3,4-dioxygenase beta subunit